ncbi:hypothetical protein SAMN06272775_0160 [Streptomyces sp. 2323.1]|nr:hypothetical protein SAMN06272775_0160 [Streptomyces sp. 2323.1]
MSVTTRTPVFGLVMLTPVRTRYFLAIPGRRARGFGEPQSVTSRGWLTWHWPRRAPPAWG